jgi:hypothetical protein
VHSFLDTLNEMRSDAINDVDSLRLAGGFTRLVYCRLEGLI